MISIRPIIIYCTETRALRYADEVKRKAFERKILRGIYGLHTGKWRIRYNREHKNVFQRPKKFAGIGKSRKKN